MSTDGLLRNGAQAPPADAKQSSTGKKKKRVVIVGAGAAGMSCAATLAQHPDLFDVTVLERAPVTGGQATSISIDADTHGPSWLNDGVQGGSPIFRHTCKFFEQYGFEAKEVRLQVAFGKGREGFWTNVFPSKLVSELEKDIRKFGKVLGLVKWTMPVLGLVPIKKMLGLCGFGKRFGERMVYPLIALFLGTGNQTANVASAILERLFDDPNMKLWDYDSSTLLPNLPTMLTFPCLDAFYKAWAADLRSKGVNIRTSTQLHSISERSAKKGITLRTQACTSDPDNPQPTGEPSEPEHYDDLVMCVLADDAKRLLGETASWREKFVLGGAHFFDDVTVTHSDADYFTKMYETKFDPELAAEPSSDSQKEMLAFAKGEKAPSGELSDETPGFRPMYYTKTYEQRPECIEMSFDCSNYQHQFREPAEGGDGKTEKREGKPHVYQTIFLDKQNEDMWTKDQISEDKVIKVKWWHQLGHRWQHYVRVVPGMMFLNGKRSTYFAGSWTLVNMHELACVSGIAAAYRLGAEYRPFDDFAEDFFSKYLLLSHGVRYKRGRKAQ